MKLKRTTTLNHSLSSKFIPYSHTQTYTDTSFTLTSLKAYNDAIWKDKLNRKQITGMCRWKLPVKYSGRDKHLVKVSNKHYLTNNRVSTSPQLLSAKNRKVIRQI